MDDVKIKEDIDKLAREIVNCIMSSELYKYEDVDKLFKDNWLLLSDYIFIKAEQENNYNFKKVKKAVKKYKPEALESLKGLEEMESILDEANYDKDSKADYLFEVWLYKEVKDKMREVL
ncbi:MAG: hypothetical protein ACOC1K_05050 [Nanoarchaeota archaeon]